MDKRKSFRKSRILHDTEIVATSPTLKQNYWRVAITTSDRYYVGSVENRHIEIVDEFYRVPLPDTDVIKAAIKDKNISSFLNFSPVYRWEINTDEEDIIEVRFIDLRYRSKGYYPFVAVVKLDKSLEVITSYTGWIFSEQKLQSKLIPSDSSP